MFHERSLPLSDRSAVISNLTQATGYYVQLNLVQPLNVYVYGETRSFTLDEVLRQPQPPLESTTGGGLASSSLLPVTMLLGVLGVLVLLVLLIVLLYLKRHSLATYCEGGGEGDPLRRKRHLNGAAIDMYDGRIQISAPFNHAVEEASALTPAPQWPEPEPIVEESEAFLPKPASSIRNGNGLPQAGARRNSRNSISSSWSSLFNVPTGADAGSVRSSTVSSGNTSGHNGTGHHRVSFAGIGSGRGYRRPSPNEQV